MQQKKEKDQGKGDRGCWDKRIGEWRGESFKGGSQGNPMEKRDLSKHLRKVRRILHSTNICISSLLWLLEPPLSALPNALSHISQYEYSCLAKLLHVTVSDNFGFAHIAHLTQNAFSYLIN